MSVVIIGGNECMVCRYQEICKKNGYKAKVFAKENGPMKKKIGSPDLMILFTGTVSHKMMICATQEAKKNGVPVLHVHSSSASARIIHSFARFGYPGHPPGNSSRDAPACSGASLFCAAKAGAESENAAPAFILILLFPAP